MYENDTPTETDRERERERERERLGGDREKERVNQKVCGFVVYEICQNGNARCVSREWGRTCREK